MQYTGLRDWIQKVDALGELRRVDGADWNLEMGAITEVYARNEPYPAILFDKIKDYPEGRRVLIGVHHMSLKRQLLTLNMPLDYDRMQFIQACRERSISLRIFRQTPKSPSRAKCCPMSRSAKVPTASGPVITRAGSGRNRFSR